MKFSALIPLLLFVSPLINANPFPGGPPPPPPPLPPGPANPRPPVPALPNPSPDNDAGTGQPPYSWDLFVGRGKKVWDILQAELVKPFPKDDLKGGKDKDDVAKKGYFFKSPNGINKGAPLDLRPLFTTLGLPQTGYEDVEVKSGLLDTPAFQNTYHRDAGVIIAEDNDSRRDTIKKLRWADAVFVTYSAPPQGKEQDCPDVTKLKYIFRHSVINENTKQVMREAYDRGKRDKAKGAWEEWTPEKNMEEFLAILGTDNGRGNAYLLIDHVESFDKKTIKSIHTRFQSGGSYAVYFLLGRHTPLTRRELARRANNPPKGQGSCKRKCQGKQVLNKDGTKCEDCPTGKAADQQKGVCVDCAKDEIVKKDGTGCDKCPSGKIPNKTKDQCGQKDCPNNQVLNGKKDGCENCPNGKQPNKAKDGCEDKDCPNDQARMNGKCDKCPSGQVPNKKKDGCEDSDETKKKKDDEAKKQKMKSDMDAKKKSSGVKGFVGGSAMAIGAGIADLIKLLPTTAWDFENNVDVCAVTMGTEAGGNCKTWVECQVGGKVEYTNHWSVCHAGGRQYFTDDRIGDFSVTFSKKESDRCPEGLCRPILQLENFKNWLEIDAEQENTNYYKPGGKGICHDSLSDKASDMSEMGKKFWWVCGVPNL
ncbi:MAG: hypothetical protein M1830_000437 [Pleopsidium flavum]|nr:MAG: hypothetical protein M1830_000437 [Pleopsidium flavum]